ncbi:MAG: hypothetical protein M1281_02665 [Chloroflexi bacterium]|nr:hypothetical protein [Chloroflexota bacterium]
MINTAPNQVCYSASRTFDFTGPVDHQALCDRVNRMEGAVDSFSQAPGILAADGRDQGAR